MKKSTLFSLMTILSTFTFSQNAFYDAQFLVTISESEIQNILDASIDNAQKFATSTSAIKPYINLSSHEINVVKDYKKFISNKFDTTIDNLDMSALKSAISKYNDYVESEKQNALYGSGVKRGIAPFGLANALSLIPNIIGGDFSLNSEQQTKIIDGLTKYYAEEFRKAQVLTYMQTFENTIGKVGELQVIFPQTYSKLQNADPSRFPELGDKYKSIFNEDLKSLIDNLINHIDNHSDKSNYDLEQKLKWLTFANNTNIKKNPYYGCFKISADIGSKLINNYHPVDLFNFLDKKYYKPELLTDPVLSSDKIASIIHGLNLVQRNLLDTSKAKENQFANIWLNMEDLLKLDTRDEWLYFTGLIYQQDKAFFNTFIFNAAGKRDKDITKEYLLKAQSKIEPILSALVEIQSFRSNLKDDNIKENFIKYMSLIVKTIEIGNYFSSAELPMADLKKYLQITDYTLNIYDNIRKKDYSNTIYYTVKILNDLLATNSDYLQVVTVVEQYGTFMTDVINAKNSDEIKDCIKKHAAPPTSFIMKREYKRTLSITGQPGYFVSIEKLDGKKQNFGFVSGISLPMGFEITFKLKHGAENSGSFGFFAQVIDLGAVLNFRISDSTSTLPDKIEFKQIFSPGASFTYGFKNSPVTLGVGYQYTPHLRKIMIGTENQIYPNGHRAFLRLSWDIPLINIAKSKSK